MKVGVYLSLFRDEPLDTVLNYISTLGIDCVELTTGGFIPSIHFDVFDLLQDDQKVINLYTHITSKNLEISALSCHANPLHPQKAISLKHQDDLINTILLAKKLNIKNVIAFSGCPGDSECSIYPNWVTCPWPQDFSNILNWQWTKKVIPFWLKTGEFARDHGVNICIEMHPGFCVYNPESFLKLREEIGDVICLNFDPSHLFWQGIDPIGVIKLFPNVIKHVHLKDTKINTSISLINGSLDTKPYSYINRRSWSFRTIGYGHDYIFWEAFIDALRMIGFDGVLSIEHEDPMYSNKKGLEKAVKFIKELLQ